MGISTRVTVGTTAVLVAQNTHSISRAEVKIKNTGAAVVALGDPTVLATTGYEVAAGAEESFNLDAGEALYGIVASGSLVVEVLAL